MVTYITVTFTFAYECNVFALENLIPTSIDPSRPLPYWDKVCFVCMHYSEGSWLTHYRFDCFFMANTTSESIKGHWCCWHPVIHMTWSSTWTGKSLILTVLISMVSVISTKHSVTIKCVAKPRTLTGCVKMLWNKNGRPRPYAIDIGLKFW